MWSCGVSGGSCASFSACCLAAVVSGGGVAAKETDADSSITLIRPPILCGFIHCLTQQHRVGLLAGRCCVEHAPPCERRAVPSQPMCLAKNSSVRFCASS